MKWLVVGAGSGGCVVARRLVDAGHEVTLVESGPPLRHGAVPAQIDGPDSFDALNLPDRTHAGLLARRTQSSAPTTYARGRGEGGSSAVNFMVGLRGDSDLYRSWGWTDAEECFDLIEVPCELATPAERGQVSTALLAAHVAASPVPLTRRNRRRITAAEAYLWPIIERLSVVTDAVVDRVRLDDTGRAVGIELADGTVLDADAVVLCAGAIHTPAIALRSGILGSPGAEVGYGLQDHPAVGLTLQLRDASSVGGLCTSAVLDLDPIQVLPLDHLGQAAPPGLAMLLVALMRPSGADGVVRLGSDDPHEHPEVDLGLLSNEGDVGRLRVGVEQTMHLLSTATFDSLVEMVFIDDLGTPLSSLRSATDIDRWIRQRGADYVHASSSMSRSLGDFGSVTGHEQLWVADTSAFPAIPDVNTHLPTMMLAERFVRSWIDSTA